jgi:gamma-glutamylcyclotransferase
MTERRYFAYGSNLHPVRLRERVSAAVLLGAAALPGHVLRFHKRGRDGSGKCDAAWTGGGGDRVLGALYRLGPTDVAVLDAIEGAGRGYRVQEVRVETGAGTLAAFAYLADPAAIDPAAVPWDWYKALVLAGARHHGFGASYVAAIEAVPSRPDRDSRRAHAHAELLARLAGGIG